MFNIIKANGENAAYGVVGYAIDTLADVVSLPTDCAIGSTAFCIENSKTYILSGSREWVEK